MRKQSLLGATLAVLVSAIVLSACQSTTQPHAGQTVAATNSHVRTTCPSQTAMRLTEMSQEIASLEKRQSRGYRTKSGVIRVANPIKLCTSPIPFVSACLPQPKITSSLQSYEDYKADRARLSALKTEHKQLSEAYPACR